MADTETLMLTWLASLRPRDLALLHTATGLWVVSTTAQRQLLTVALCQRWPTADPTAVVAAMRTLSARHTV